MRLKTRITALVAALAYSVAAWGQTDGEGAVQDSPGRTLVASFDQASPGVAIATQFSRPDFVPGVVGSAWRSDGFSAWASAPFNVSNDSEFTVAIWAALESYPSDLEVPVDRLSPSSLFNQSDGRSGFDVFIDTYGRWGLKVATNRDDVTLTAPERFPLSAWTHVAARIEDDRATLFLNGAPVATAPFPRGAHFRAARRPLQIARSPQEVQILNFTVNRLNGAFDELVVFDSALTDAAIGSLYSRVSAPDAAASLIVPESRFANDHLRPRLHAMPPAGWTNEPHGLTRVGHTWHMFYQRTPNGPFKTQMHWGHIASDDLVAWRHLPDALAPELQSEDFGFDQKGIWSGDVILDAGRAFAFYTSVNHRDRLAANNPAIAMAVSEDPDLRRWRKTGPIINTAHVRDFRDPYLFRSGGTWHMIIGAQTLQGHGGLDYHVLRPSDQGGGRWEWQDDFSATSYRAMDVGSAIWEMPVFEPLRDDIWVLTAAPIGSAVSKYGDPATRSVYWTGRWDGRQFTPFSATARPLDIIVGHISPTVDRAEDGTIRAIGIVDERRTPQAQEDAGWAHAFSFPRTWFLMSDGRTLGQSPAPELRALRGEPLLQAASQRLSGQSLDVVESLRAYEIEIRVEEIGAGGVLGLDVLAAPGDAEVTRIRIDTAANEIIVDKSRSTRSDQEEGPRILRGAFDVAAFGPVHTVRVFVDGSVVEVFINDAAAFSFRSYPTRDDSTGIRIFAVHAPVVLSGVTLWPLRPATIEGS